MTNDSEKTIDHVKEEIVPMDEEDDVHEHHHLGTDEEVEGFDFDSSLLGGAFDPMMTLGQFVTTENGETIPDMLVKINETLGTLTKVLHKISKSLEKS